VQVWNKIKAGASGGVTAEAMEMKMVELGCWERARERVTVPSWKAVAWVKDGRARERSASMSWRTGCGGSKGEQFLGKFGVEREAYIATLGWWLRHSTNGESNGGPQLTSVNSE